MLLSITNLTTHDFVIQDPSGLSNFSTKVAASSTKTGLKVAQMTYAALEPLLQAAVAASEITFIIASDPTSLADDPHYNQRIGLVSPIVVDVHDDILVSKLTSPGAVAVTLPTGLPIGKVIDIVDGTGDAASNNITITATGATINGAGTLALNANYGGCRLVQIAANVWVRTSLPGVGPSGAAGGDLSGSYPNPLLAVPIKGVEQALSGAGAVDVTHRTTQLTSTGAAQALTLADGASVGQRKSIFHKVDGGSMVLTPTTPSGFSTITFTAARDWVELEWQTGGWRLVGFGGATFT